MKENRVRIDSEKFVHQNVQIEAENQPDTFQVRVGEKKKTNE